jgi:hypothetical protein
VQLLFGGPSVPEEANGYEDTPNEHDGDAELGLALPAVAFAELFNETPSIKGLGASRR